MALMCNTRFERYNRGDLVEPRQEERFRGTYPHSVVEVTDVDAAALADAQATGSVGAWIEQMCAKPSLLEEQNAQASGAAKPEPKPLAHVPMVTKKGKKAQKPEPVPAPEPEPVEEPGEDTPTAEESDD